MTLIKDLSKSSGNGSNSSNGGGGSDNGSNSSNGGGGSDNGSNSSNGGGSGNNSDNSALVSLGNTSFGFNFDSEEGNSSPRNCNNSEEGDSASDEGGKPKSGEAPKTQKKPVAAKPAAKTSSNSSTMDEASHNDAAAAAVANLQSIANKMMETGDPEKQSLKRKAQESVDNDSGGYNSDDEEGRTADASAAASEPGTEPQEEANEEETPDKPGSKGCRKKKKLNEMKREERNQREKERSFRISRQINELRGLLSSGGVIVPKGTKSSVLTEAATYIRMLQQHQYRSEIDRHQLVQQIQMIGGGALGQPAATAVRHVAAQNGVWSLGNFGGVPPKSAMMYHQPEMSTLPGDASSDPTIQQQQDGSVLPNKIDVPDYRYVFSSCTIGMAIASMGGAFIDCNKLFCQLSNYTKQEVCSMTIFNLTARQDLQHAFDLISQMLSAPIDPNGNAAMNTCVLRGSLKDRTDLGLSVTLIKGDDDVAKSFCVTLVLNPQSPFQTQRPTPATIDCVDTSLQATKGSGSTGKMDPTPAYTTG